MLARGNGRHPCVAHAGYPNSVVTGQFNLAIVAAGDTAARRRRSRVELWKNVAGFARCKLEIPERPDFKSLAVHYEGPALPHGAGFQLRARGRRPVASVTWNGRPLGPSATDGYQTWYDPCSTFVAVATPTLARGEHRVEVAFGPEGG